MKRLTKVWQRNMRRIDSAVSSVPQVRVTIFGRYFNTWRTLVTVGILAGTMSLFGLSALGNLGWFIPALLTMVNLAAFYVLPRIYTKFFGRNRIVLLEYLFLIVPFCALALALIGAPVLPGLDVWIVSISLGLAIGRLGCFCSGCCYGRLAIRGVHYTSPFLQNLPAVLRQTRIVPVQLYESSLLMVIFIAGTWWNLRSHQPGDMLLLFMLFYGTGRFVLEFFRGDTRPYLWRLSEAQWTGLAMVILIGLLSSRWLTAALAGLVVIFLATLWQLTHLGPPLIRSLSRHDINELWSTLQKQSEMLRTKSQYTTQWVTTHRGLSLRLVKSEPESIPQVELHLGRQPNNSDKALLSYISNLLKEATKYKGSEQKP